MEWIIYIVIYFASAIAWYFSIRYQFTNEFKHINPTWFEVLIAFVPFINTFWSILNWGIIFANIRKKKSNYRNKYLAARFFGTKK